MTLAEIKELILSLENIEDIEWTIGGTIRYETILDGKIIIVDRRNNADNDTSECYLKVGTFENVYSKGTKEYEELSNFVVFLDSKD
jgi:hypothetical protein